MVTGALRSIIFACVYVWAAVCVYSICFELRCLSFSVSCLFFSYVSVFVTRVDVLCLCPRLAPFHKHLVDSVIFSAVFTSPTRHIGALLVNSLSHTRTSTRAHTADTSDTLREVLWQKTNGEAATFTSLTKNGKWSTPHFLTLNIVYLPFVKKIHAYRFEQIQKCLSVRQVSTKQSSLPFMQTQNAANSLPACVYKANSAI